MWIHLIRGEARTESITRGVRRPIRADGFSLQICEKRTEQYIPFTMVTNKQDWDKGWF